MIPMAAQANSFNDLNSAYISSVSQLPAIQDNQLKPDKVWQPSEDFFKDNCRRSKNPYFVNGWIDIIGFRNSTKINNTVYINESPESSVIIRYETNVCALDRPRFKGGWNYDLKTYQEGNQFVVKLTATAILYYYIEANKYYDNITAIFSDSDPIPQKYPTSTALEIKVHTFTNSSRSIIEVNTDNLITAYSIRTQNGSVSEYRKVFQVAYTQKGIPYANESSNIPIWNNTGKGIDHQGNDIISDSSNISFTAYTPFGNISRANITYIPETNSTMSSLNLFIGLVFVLGYTACKMAVRMVK